MAVHGIDPQPVAEGTWVYKYYTFMPREDSVNDGTMTIADVKQYTPNAWGLYDMHGNVAEWCEDRFGRYPKETVVNPTGSLKAPNRVVRGGGYFSDKTQIRSFDRWASSPNCLSKFFGLRLAMKSF
jgi:formylglycine-generating enzyme required for sulfatase activity